MNSNFSAVSIYNKQKCILSVVDQENQGTGFAMEDKAEAQHQLIQKAENSVSLLEGKRCSSKGC